VRVEKGNLIISRKLGSRLLIGDDIEITFVCLQSDHGCKVPEGVSVKVAIRAPKELLVLRGELQEGWVPK
jgi:carbon storage regulator CsrA